MGVIDRFEKRPRALSHLDSEEFAKVLRIAIRYHHRPISDDADERQSDVVEVVDPDMLALLADAFDDELYVQRHVAERLLELSLRARSDVVVLSAERGSGKTTLWDRAARRPELVGLNVDTAVPDAMRGLDPFTHVGERVDRWVASGDEVALDAKVATASLHYYSAREPGFPRSTNANEIASSIIADLLPTFITSHQARVAWKRFRLLNARAFTPVLTEYGQELEDVPESEMVDARKRFMDNEAEDGLSVLLRFIRRTFRHRVVFIVDNLDSEPPATRLEVAKIFARFARVMSGGRNKVSLVLPLRPRNAAEIAEVIESVIDGAVIEFPLGLHVEDDVRDIVPAGSTPAGGSDARVMAVALVASFLDSRIDFISSWLGTDQSEIVERNREVLELFCQEGIYASNNRNLIDHFTRWYNGSLRAIAEAFERILLDALSGTNPASSAQTIMGLIASPTPHDSQWIDQVKIVTRLHSLRKFIFSVDRDDSATPNINRVPAALPFIRLSRTANPRGIFFLKVHILEYLRRRERGSTTLAVLQDVLSNDNGYGVRPEEVNRAVRELAAQRYTGDSGLLEIEGWHTRVHEVPQQEPQQISVSLQWAGEYLIDVLCHTSDFLFWAAATRDETTHIFEEAAKLLGDEIDASRPAGVPYRLVELASFRFAVAARFLTEFLLPKFRIEIPVPAGDPRVDLEHAIHFMNDFGSTLFLVRTHNIMSAFLGTLVGCGLLERDVAVQLRPLLHPVRDYLADLRKAGVEWSGNLDM
ncbi:MAG: hypothetical protein K8R99_00635 [Actinomycetia bacterium]|nr:hypothetical protein [Actinomycetes bacterium]